MGDDEIGRYCADGLAGIVRKADELRPYFEDVWRRFAAGQAILACHSRTEYCNQILHCSIRRVQHILYGRTSEKPVAEEPDRNLNLFEDNSITTQAEPILSPTEVKAQELTALLEGIFGKGQGRAKFTVILTEDRLRELAARMSERNIEAAH